MAIDRRAVLGGSAAGLLAASAPVLAKPAPTPGERPNFLLFISEDNTPLIGAYGDKLARTPTIDRLARDGVLFEHAYVTSPVCGPSRFSILTGIYPESAGMAQFFGSTDEVLPRNVRGFSAYFRDTGYYCTNTAKQNYNSQFDFVPSLWDESSEAAHWRNRAPSQAFLAVFTSMTTHESSQFPGVPGAVKPAMVRVPPYLPDTAGVRGDIASFYNAMEKMDGELAARLAELAAAGVADDTIVVYCSDNGGISPRGKRFLYQMGTRVPLIVWAPPKWRHLIEQPVGSRVAAPVSLLDLKPTLLSLAGMAPPAYCEGKVILGKGRAVPQRHAFSGRTRMDERYDFCRAVPDTRFRYIRNYTPHRPYGQHLAFMMMAKAYQDWEGAYRAGSLSDVQAHFWRTKPHEELYDLVADPDQVTNLARDPAHAATLAELAAALDAHMLAVNDNGFIPETAGPIGYVTSRLRGAYLLPEIMALAARAARGDPESRDDLVAALDHDHEVMRYWGAQGLLIRGEQARPALSAIRAAFRNEQSPAVRISLAETLVALEDDREALRALGFFLDTEDDGPLRLQAINALTYLGEKVRPILPAIRRSAKEDHRFMQWAANYLIELLEGRYDPHRQPQVMSGYVRIDPETDSPPMPRFYD